LPVTHGEIHSEEGDVYSAGWNSHGQCGLPSSSSSPFKKIPLEEVIKIEPLKIEKQQKDGEKVRCVDIACGEKHSLVLDSLGRVWTFGSNSDNQLSTNDEKRIDPDENEFGGEDEVKEMEGNSCPPRLVRFPLNDLVFDVDNVNDLMDMDLPENESNSENENGGSFDTNDAGVKIESLVCGARHNLAIDENGMGMFSPSENRLLFLITTCICHVVYGWGWSGYMQLGQNEVHDIPLPLLIDLPEPIVKVAAGTWHTLFLSGA